MPVAAVLLSIGSNLPGRAAHDAISGAWEALAAVVTVTARSRVYETTAEGLNAVGTYANCIAKGLTDLTLDALEREMKAIEISCGRGRGHRDDGCVPIDLDIVQYGDTIIRPKNWTMSYMRQGLAELGIAPATYAQPPLTMPSSAATPLQ